MLGLDQLKPCSGSTKQKKRIGRGNGTGQGKQAGKGHKGFKARSGSSIRPGFEGGQMPLHRRIPKRGFKNSLKDIIGIINVGDLNILTDGSLVNTEILHKFGLVKKKFNKIKLLGDGEISKRFVIKLDYVSVNAKQKIESLGGTIEA